MLETLSISIEKERPVWGYHHIAGATAEEKINTLWHTFPHEEFLEALFYLADYKHSSSILNLLIKEEANEIRDAIHAPIHFTSYKQGWKSEEYIIRSFYFYYGS